MKIYAIGDPHLSHSKPKPMHVFGENWRDHEKKIEENWRAIAQPDDVLIVAGDISWAMRMEEARPDLEYIARLPGRKVILKGNHDYWWSSKKKVKEAAGDTVEVLQADSIVIGGVAIVGTRGWQCPGDDPSADIMAEGSNLRYTEEDRKIYEREVGRLRMAFESLRGKSYERLIVALHYPPVNGSHEPSGFTDLIDSFPVEVCVYGHLHGPALANSFNGTRNGTRYRLVSADFVDFIPVLIIES